MKSIEKIIFFLLPLSILFSSLTFIPNRILVVCLLLIIFVRNRFFTSLIFKKKWIILAGVLYVLLIALGNEYLSKEALLFLTLPLYPFLYGQSSLTKFLLKKYFILAVFTYSMLIVLIKSFKIISFGVLDFFQQEQWWNQVLYKNLTIELHAHPTYVAMFIMASIVMLLDQINKKEKYFSFVNYVFILSLSLLVLLLLVVKISFLALLMILIVFMFFLLSKSHIKTAVISMILFILTSIIAYNIPGIKHRLLVDLRSMQNIEPDRLEINRLMERTALWKASLNYMNQNPIVGSSIQGVSSKSSIYPVAKSIYPQLESQKNCHNNFLEFGVRYGFIGIGLFSLFILFFLREGIKLASFEIIGLWILIFCFSLTESFMFREQGISLVSILLATFRIHFYGKDI